MNRLEALCSDTVGSLDSQNDRFGISLPAREQGSKCSGRLDVHSRPRVSRGSACAVSPNPRWYWNGMLVEIFPQGATSIFLLGQTAPLQLWYDVLHEFADIAHRGVAAAEDEPAVGA
jgi:hypothetical protein